MIRVEGAVYAETRPLEMEFRTAKLRQACESFKKACRTWGQESAKRLVQRLNEIEAAETLDVLLQLPGARCHLLKHDRAGQFAVDLKHPKRLVFEPAGSPEDYMVGNSIDPSRVTKVLILEVVDYHG